MSKDGILFYSNFEVITPLLTVALHSLRKNYSGNIHVCLGDETPDFYKEMIKDNKDVTCEVIPHRYYKADHLRRRAKGWYEKPFVVNQHNPFDRVVFFDCDHVFYKAFDLSIFDEIEEHGLTTSVAGGLPGRHAKILAQINRATGYNFEQVPRMSAGCVGLKKSSGLGDEWVKYFRLCRESGSLLSKLSDEFGLSIVFRKGHGKYLSDKWSFVYPKRKRLSECPAEVDAIHFAAGRYGRGNLFSDALAQCIADNYMGVRDNLAQCLGVNSVTNTLLNNGNFMSDYGG